jgi:Na+/melibiose symporter-like transporter
VATAPTDNSSRDGVAAADEAPASAAPVIPGDADARAQKRWHVGTLTYTTAGLVVLFFWLLWGDFAFYLKERAVPPTLQVLLRTYGTTALLLGVLTGSLPQLIGMFLGPVVSYKSDRHRGRWGRRIPFLLIPTPIAVASMIGLAFSPPLGSALYRAIGPGHLSKNGCIILCLGVFWTLFEVATIICNAVFGGLINDVVPRAVIGRFFALFRAMSLIAGMIFHQKLLGTAQQHYVGIFLTIGALYGVSFTAMCVMVREGQYPPPPQDDLAIPRGGLLDRLSAGIGTYFRDCFTKPYYLWFFLSFMLAYIAFEPINIYSLMFGTSLGLTDQQYGHWSAVQLGVSLIQAWPVGWLADRFHPIRVTMVALGMYAVATLLAFFYVRSAPAFAVAHVVCGSISGIWLTATAPLGPALLPRAKFATLLSAVGICSAIGRFITAPVIGWLLDRMNPGRPIQQYDFHYIFLWTATFTTLSLGASFVLYRYFMAFGGPKNYVAPD